MFKVFKSIILFLMVMILEGIVKYIKMNVWIGNFYVFFLEGNF